MPDDHLRYALCRVLLADLSGRMRLLHGPLAHLYAQTGPPLNDLKEGRVGLYHPGARIITIGDGDLTFSSALAQTLLDRVHQTDSNAGEGHPATDLLPDLVISQPLERFPWLTVLLQASAQ
jgi:hypothetical protein